MSFRISKWQSRKLDSGKAVSGNIREDDSEQNPDITQLKDDEEELKVGWFRSVISVFTTSPYDWYLSLNEDIAVIDWDAKSNTIAWPLGNILTFSFFAIRLLQDNLITPNIYKFNHSQDAFDFSKSSNLKKYEYFQKYQNNNGGSNEFYYRMLGYLHQLFSILTILLFLANLTITYRYLFAHYQTYSIFYWKSIPRSKNVVKRSLHDLNHKYIEDAERDSLWGMLKYLLFNKSNSDDISHQEHYYELRKWTPSRFLTCLFISFSPICFCFLWAIRVSFKTLIPVVIHQYVLWFLVIDRYEQRVKDEQILAMANLAEINAKIIQPKASALKQDAMVDATPYNNSTVYFYPAYTTTRSHVFETHTLTGDLIKEKYNPQTKMFEDTIPGRSNNYVRFSRELKGINGGSMRQPFLSRQTSPRLSPVRYADSYGEKSPSAPSTPMVIPSPVSYTHLDVYKRQLLILLVPLKFLLSGLC